MQQEVWNMVMDKGIFAVLFVGMLIYTIKNHAKREERYIEREIKYQTLLEKISNTLKKEVCDIKAVVCELAKKED